MVDKFKIITLCGITSVDVFLSVSRELSLKGYIVINCDDFIDSDRESLSDAMLYSLSELHFQKIDMSDEVFIINKGGVITDNLMDEIIYSKFKNKPLLFLEPVDENILDRGIEKRLVGGA